MARTPWTSHRSRAVALCGRYPFAAEPLTLYVALLDVWETGWELARAERPAPRKLAAWATERVLPGVVTATGAAGRPRAGAARCTPNGATVRSSAGPGTTPLPTPPSRTCGSTAAPAVDGT